VRLARQNADRGVRFLGIDTRDNLASARAFVNKFKVPYPSLFDEGGRVLLPFRGVIPTAVIPSSVVIDRQGRVAARVIGPVTYSTLKGVLDDELAGGKK
jgi:peroxiredoxin